VNARGLAYIDTSAAAKLILDEPEQEALVTELRGWPVRVSSALLGAELRRVGLRFDALAEAERLLRGIALVSVTDDLLVAAGRAQPAALRTLDAVHLATALRVHGRERIGAVFCYDGRLTGAAQAHGLTVLSPR
jgi:predicted nucleic acid-binding protein